jgi:oxygen-independent coproporphyrinogen-3 oxidase
LTIVKPRRTPLAHSAAMDTAVAEPVQSLSHEMLRRLDTPGPRYTSYPTADRFDTAFGEDDYRAALRASAMRATQPLSVYVHVPFCASLCWYCACNKIITRHHEEAERYLDALEREIALHVAELGSRRSMTHMHFGGGTPTFLADDELARLTGLHDAAFDRCGDIEASIEVDPRTVTPERLATLRKLGFNRISFGVQDFDPAVQQAVHRVQSVEQVASLLDAARALGFVSTNVDLIYGLPKQTPESFTRTVEQVLALQPDRIALYAYAHLPERFKSQRRIHAADLPTPAPRVSMLGTAIETFTANDYDYIGMDHFARHGDSLARARREGRLFRNFQGYTTRAGGDLLGLGVSAIGKIGDTYSQNVKGLALYYEAIDAGRLAIERGCALTPDDLLRRDVIMALMCQGRVAFDAIERTHRVRFADVFATELRDLQPLAEMGWVGVQPDAIEVSAIGWYFVRSIAAMFDAHLRRSPASRALYSKVG